MNVGTLPATAVDAKGSVGALDWLAVIADRGTAVGFVAAKLKLYVVVGGTGVDTGDPEAPPPTGGAFEAAPVDAVAPGGAESVTGGGVEVVGFWRG